MENKSPQMQNKYVTTVEKTSSMHKFLRLFDSFQFQKLNHPCIETNTIANLNNRDLMPRNVNHTIFPTFYFSNNNEVRNY